MIILNDELAVNPVHVVALHVLNDDVTLVELVTGNRLEVQLSRDELINILAGV